MNGAVVVAGAILVAVGFFGVVVPAGVVGLVRMVTMLVALQGGDTVDPAKNKTTRQRHHYRKVARVVSVGIAVAGLAIVALGLVA